MGSVQANLKFQIGRFGLIVKIAAKLINSLFQTLTLAGAGVFPGGDSDPPNASPGRGGVPNVHGTQRSRSSIKPKLVNFAKVD